MRAELWLIVSFIAFLGWRIIAGTVYEKGEAVGPRGCATVILLYVVLYLLLR